MSRRREQLSPPRKASNPEESAYMRAIEKQKQERETVLKMKAIKRKLEVEKKKRDGDKDSPEKKEGPTVGTSKEPPLLPKKPLLATPMLNTVMMKPKIKGTVIFNYKPPEFILTKCVIVAVIKKEDQLRKISLISQGDQPLVSKVKHYFYLI